MKKTKKAIKNNKVGKKSASGKAKLKPEPKPKSKSKPKLKLKPSLKVKLPVVAAVDVQLPLPSRSRVIGSPRTVMSARVDSQVAAELFKISVLLGHRNISETVAEAIDTYVGIHGTGDSRDSHGGGN